MEENIKIYSNLSGFTNNISSDSFFFLSHYSASCKVLAYKICVLIKKMYGRGVRAEFD